MTLHVFSGPPSAEQLQRTLDAMVLYARRLERLLGGESAPPPDLIAHVLSTNPARPENRASLLVRPKDANPDALTEERSAA